MANIDYAALSKALVAKLYPLITKGIITGEDLTNQIATAEAIAAGILFDALSETLPVDAPAAAPEAQITRLEDFTPKPLVLVPGAASEEGYSGRGIASFAVPAGAELERVSSQGGSALVAPGGGVFVTKTEDKEAEKPEYVLGLDGVERSFDKEREELAKMGVVTTKYVGRARTSSLNHANGRSNGPLDTSMDLDLTPDEKRVTDNYKPSQIAKAFDGEE